MYILDLFFNNSFDGVKCKTLLKLTISHIKLLRNNSENHLKQMRKEIAKLLLTGKEAAAYIWVEHIVWEQNMMDVYEIIELFCEIVVVHLPVIENQRECPMDLKESITSLIFAAPRCSGLPELLQVQNLFLAKYGKQFVAAATELKPDCGVNQMIIGKLSACAPTAEVKLKIMKKIAEEHQVDWDSSITEPDFFRLQEDLPDGPNHVVTQTDVLTPYEEEDESHFTPIKLPNNSMISETRLIFPVPRVPKQEMSLRSREVVPTSRLRHASSAYLASQAVPESNIFRLHRKTILQMKPIGLDIPVVNIGSPVSSPTSSVCASSDMHGEKQLVSIFSLPPSLTNLEKKSGVNEDSPSREKAQGRMYFEDAVVAAHAAADSAESAEAVARSSDNLVAVRISELTANAGSVENSEEMSSLKGESTENCYLSKHIECFSGQSCSLESNCLPTSRRQQETDFDLKRESEERIPEGQSDLDARKSLFETMNPLDVGIHLQADPRNSGHSHHNSPRMVLSDPPERVMETLAFQHLAEFPSMNDVSYISYFDIFDAQSPSSNSDQVEFQTLR